LWKSNWRLNGWFGMASVNDAILRGSCSHS
jgi:hypothetical protein